MYGVKTLTSIAGAAQQIVETRWYDLNGKLVKRVAGGSGVGGSTGLRNDTLTYDLRGKALGNGFYTASYTPLGYLNAGNLGGQPETFIPDAFGNSAGGSRGSNGITNRFQARTGRITFTEEIVPGGRDTTLYYYTLLGAQGDKVHIQYLGGSPPNVQQMTRSELHTYTADNKLAKVFINVDSTPPPTGIYKPYRFEETYRYDALGRRIETRLWRTTNCPSKDPDSGCQNTLTRTIWDGSQMLYELRWLFAATDTIPGVWSTGDGVPGGGTYWGTVGYTHGLGIDQPLDLFKGTPVVVPHANWRGMLDQGTCPTTFCPGDSPAFPGKLASAYGATAPGLNVWYGTLIGGNTDGSGYLYRRNRYVDPSNGRFTQEDPIGLAGGLNLYGFAEGDPVNFTDPFGLDPCKASSAWTECLAQAIADWGAQQGGTAGRIALNGGAALNAGLEATGFNAAASAGDAIGSGRLGEGGTALAMTLLPIPGKGAGKAVAGKITGFTKHGINSAISHDGVGVASKAIFDAVTNPLRTIQQSGGRVRYVGKDAAVLLNEAGEVITTWARSSAGWRIKP